MGNHTNEVEDAAPGEAGADAAGPTKHQVMEALASVSERARIHEPETFPAHAAVMSACVSAVAQGVNPLVLARALAGGDEVAAARLFDFGICTEPDILPWHVRNAMEALLQTARPEVRAEIVRQLPHLLTDDELAVIVRSINDRAAVEAVNQVAPAAG